jgi:hypothetical protein
MYNLDYAQSLTMQKNNKNTKVPKVKCLPIIFSFSFPQGVTLYFFNLHPFYLFILNSPMFWNFISILFYLTLANIFSGSQKTCFLWTCFDKWNGNCVLQSASKISDEKTARSKKLLSCFSVLSLCTSLTRFLFFSRHELWDISCFSLTDRWTISFIIKNWF